VRRGVRFPREGQGRGQWEWGKFPCRNEKRKKRGPRERAIVGREEKKPCVSKGKNRNMKKFRKAIKREEGGGTFEEGKKNVRRTEGSNVGGKKKGCPKTTDPQDLLEKNPFGCSLGGKDFG